VTILVSVLAGFAAAVCAPVAVRFRQAAAGYWLSAVPAALLFFFLVTLAKFSGDPIAVTYPWVPSLSLDLSFYVDGVSLLFAILISGMGLLVTVYSAGYLKDQPQLGRYYGWLMVFTAAMLGVVTSDNLLLLYVFWELTSISSFMLIGYRHEDEDARQGALQSLLVTNMGGLALLAGVLLLGLAGGTLEVSDLLNRREQISASPLLAPAIILILTGVMTKSAQFPFHFWLPRAMVAPAPVSAYLHSAAMVKAGIYLMIRLSPVMSGNDWWSSLGIAVGVATLLLGSYMSLCQTDIKLLLAYSTIGALGLITLLTALGSAHALEGAIAFLLAHALYKGSLFLVSGVIDHETGTRDVTQLGGLLRFMPVTAAASFIAALSMAGIPPLFGSVAKEIAYEAGVESGAAIATVVFAGGVSFVFVAVMAGGKPFLDTVPGARKSGHPGHVPFSMWIGPAILGAVTLLLGIFPQSVGRLLIEPAVLAVTVGTGSIDLPLWPGLKLPLFLSLAGIVAGAVLYRFNDQVRRRAAALMPKWGPEKGYELVLKWMNAVAVAQTRLLQTGYLHHYLIITMATAVVIVGIPLLRKNIDIWYRWLGLGLEVGPGELLLALLVVFASIWAVRSKTILGAVAAMGAAGYGVATIYMVFSAPDLAMTQFLIESLTVILFVLVFHRFPGFQRLSSARSRAFDGAIAIAGGLMVTLLVVMAAGTELAGPVSEYFVRASVPEAHGRNIVNVILVDFRALDTMGETTVLGIAAIGVYALLKSKRVKTRGSRQK